VRGQGPPPSAHHVGRGAPGQQESSTSPAARSVGSERRRATETPERGIRKYWQKHPNTTCSGGRGGQHAQEGKAQTRRMGALIASGITGRSTRIRPARGRGGVHRSSAVFRRRTAWGRARSTSSSSSTRRVSPMTPMMTPRARLRDPGAPARNHWYTPAATPGRPQGHVHGVQAREEAQGVLPLRNRPPFCPPPSPPPPPPPASPVLCPGCAWQGRIAQPPRPPGLPWCSQGVLSSLAAWRRGSCRGSFRLAEGCCAGKLAWQLALLSLLFLLSLFSCFLAATPCAAWPVRAGGCAGAHRRGRNPGVPRGGCAPAAVGLPRGPWCRLFAFYLLVFTSDLKLAKVQGGGQPGDS